MSTAVELERELSRLTSTSGPSTPALDDRKKKLIAIAVGSFLVLLLIIYRMKLFSKKDDGPKEELEFTEF